MPTETTFYAKFYYGCIASLYLCCFLCGITFVSAIVIQMLFFGSLTGLIVNASYKIWEDHYLNF